MAFSAAVDYHGDTKDLLARYDKVSPKVFALGPQPGHIAHYCLETDYGMRVVNIFETEEQTRAFYERPAFRSTLEEGGIEYHAPVIWRVHNSRHLQ
jgi:hypothetical protein